MEEMILAGFGGQGIMSMGQMIAYSGMVEGKNVTWLPSYGPEMRGGTANCNVIVSEDDIASPIIADASIVVVMNKPSLEKFEKRVAPGGKIFVNSSLIDIKVQRDDIEVFYIPASDMAVELGNVKVANMILMGAIIENTGVITIDSVIGALKKVLGKNKTHLLEVNEEALALGAKSLLEV